MTRGAVSSAYLDDAVGDILNARAAALLRIDRASARTMAEEIVGVSGRASVDTGVSDVSGVSGWCRDVVSKGRPRAQALTPSGTDPVSVSQGRWPLSPTVVVSAAI